MYLREAFRWKEICQPEKRPTSGGRKAVYISSVSKNAFLVLNVSVDHGAFLLMQKNLSTHVFKRQRKTDRRIRIFYLTNCFQ